MITLIVCMNHVDSIALQANGLEERFNQTLQGMLVKFASSKREHWDDFLDTCIFAYNTSVQESTQYSPFEIMFGRKATLPIDINMAKHDAQEKLKKYKSGGSLTTTEMEKLASYRRQVIQEAKENIKQAQAKQKETYDRKHAHPHAFQVGSKVLKKDFLRKKRAHGKIDARYLGPYVITKNLGKGLYSLALVSDSTHTVSRVHGAHLKPYHMPPPTGNSVVASSSAQATERTTHLPVSTNRPPSASHASSCGSLTLAVDYGSICAFEKSGSTRQGNKHNITKMVSYKSLLFFSQYPKICLLHCAHFRSHMPTSISSLMENGCILR